MIVAEAHHIQSYVLGFVEENRNVLVRMLAVPPGGDQEEAIHDLRVATKKVRTIFRLTEFIAPDHFDQKAEIKGLRTLFRAAGLLRELQVHEQVVANYELLHAALYRRLSRLLLQEARAILPHYEQARKQFKQSMLNSPFKKMAAIFGGISEPALLVQIQRLFVHRIAGIEEAMPKDYQPELIHKGRILLKEAMYLLALLHNVGALDATQARILENAKIAAEIAGNWHDREAFLHWLRHQMRPSGPIAADDPAYRMLIQDLSVHTHALANDFRKALVPVLHSVNHQTHPK